MAEGCGLLNRCRVKSPTEGSNPSLSVSPQPRDPGIEKGKEGKERQADSGIPRTA